MQVFWHRRDLRAADNVGLAAAAEAAARDGERVVPVFCFDKQVLDYAGPPRAAFLLDALARLREWYRERGSDLVVLQGDPSAALVDFVEHVHAERVVWNYDYSGLARERDAAVRAALNDASVEHVQFHDAVLHEPGAIRTSKGDPYSVYTYFWKKWRDREKDEPVAAPDATALADPNVYDIDCEPLPTLDDLGLAAPEAEVVDAGTDVARDRLGDFLQEDVYRYDEARDYPAERATSRLSQDLKFGTIGIREVYTATEDAMADAKTDEQRDGVKEFQSQLAWREFYAQVLRFNPETVAENYREYEEPIEWREAPEEIRAWKAGETGYPIVDAGMRQLQAEAYMHNRVRMIVASFLTKDLLIDWREGYQWFRKKLVDHDPASDAGGWQWAASTGTDAQPYFRVFNPTTQGERYDPDAEYITEYVPELRGVEAETIHAWPDLSEDERGHAAPDYPDPIVDHAERRERAIEMFERARGE